MRVRKMELSPTLNISVKQGFSSYLKLLREKNGKSWWINLSRNCFEKMLEMKEDIMKWMQNSEPKECLQMGTVTVVIKLFEDEYYMCIEKKNGDYVNRINLNGTEWVNFQKMFVKIMGQLSPTLNISVKQGFSSYLKLLREKNGKSWWINLSRNCFEKMFEMKEDVMKWMQNGEPKECLQMGTVTVAIKLFEDEYYMCIEKKMGIT